MVKKAALKTAGISMAGFQPRAQVFDGQTPLSTGYGAGEVAREPGKPFTGVGSVMAAITREAEISHELAGTQAKLVQVQRHLADFNGACLVRAIDPRTVRRSRWANRVEAEFSTAEFRRLKDDIAEAGGNVQPIKVRAIGAEQVTPDRGSNGVFDGQTAAQSGALGTHQGRVFDGQTVRQNTPVGTGQGRVFDGQTVLENAPAGTGHGRVFDGQTVLQNTPAGTGQGKVFDGQTPTHEIVFGHRRHQACLELGLPVNAVLVEDMDDRALFEAMDRENRGRKNLSAWEQGRMYDEAIRHGLYPSLRRLSDSLGVNLSDASRSVQLARLPPEVVAAFGTPLDLQVRWAKPLVDALQRDPDGVLARARLLAEAPANLSRTAVDVVARLLAEKPKPQPFEAAIKAGKRTLATCRQDALGRTTIDIPPGVLSSGRHEALTKLLKAFLADQAVD